MKKSDCIDIELEHYKNVYNQAKKATKNHEDAEDIAQRTFLNYHRFKKNFRGTCKLSSYLYSICLNEIRMHFRQKKIHDKAVRAVKEYQASALFEAYTKMRLKPGGAIKLLEKITDKNEQEMLFYRILGLESGDLSHVLGKSVPATKSITHRLRLRLKEGRCKFYDKLKREIEDTEAYDSLGGLRGEFGNSNFSV